MKRYILAKIRSKVLYNIKWMYTILWGKDRV